MKPATEELFNKIVTISANVKEELYNADIVIPIKNNNGSLKIGSYTLLKTSTGFYAILDSVGVTIIDQINLPQTAAVVANKLALGKFIDRTIIKKDSDYGYALFEETLHRKAAERTHKQDPDYSDLRMLKSAISKLKKDGFKRDILKSFEKLRKPT
jgi:hypothetical protein